MNTVALRIDWDTQKNSYYWEFICLDNQSAVFRIETCLQLIVIEGVPSGPEQNHNNPNVNFVSDVCY